MSCLLERRSQYLKLKASTPSSRSLAKQRGWSYVHGSASSLPKGPEVTRVTALAGRCCTGMYGTQCFRGSILGGITVPHVAKVSYASYMPQTDIGNYSGPYGNPLRRVLAEAM